jgi:hypothetical protein
MGMDVSTSGDIDEPLAARLLCSGANSAAMTEPFASLRCRKERPADPGDVRTSRRTNMKTLRINADEALWRNSMLPEGVLERWLVADGDTVREGHAIVQVRIEGALHDIVAPATGRLAISAPRLSVIDPGFLLATLAVGAEAAAEA